MIGEVDVVRVVAFGSRQFFWEAKSVCRKAFEDEYEKLMSM
jgi:hypothetical protein